MFFFQGDHDAILVLLLIPRLLCKSEILLTQIRDKFAVVEKVDRAGLLKGHAVEQYAFRSRLSHYIFALQVCPQAISHFKHLTDFFNKNTYIYFIENI